MNRFEIEPDSSLAPYEQVRIQIAQQVSTGRLEAGEKLPTVRQLAADLGLAVNTVARAFRELEVDGVITTRGRKGSFVSSQVLDGAGDVSGLATAAEQYAAVARTSGISLAEATRLVERAWPSA